MTTATKTSQAKLTKLIKKAQETVQHLSFAVIDENSQDFDFSEGYTEKWDIVYPSDEAILEYNKDNCDFENCEETKEDYVERIKYETEDFHPIYNTLYPVYDADADALLLEGSSMTLVEVDDEKYLALTGCGMDMSWQIVKSYISQGLLPPASFSLPKMAGKGLDYETILCIEAVKASNKAMMDRSYRAAKEAQSLYEYYSN